MHKINLKLMNGSTWSRVVGGDRTVKFSGELLREEMVRLAPPRASLNALLLQDDEEDEAVLPDHSMVQGVASIDASLEVSGELPSVVWRQHRD
jgi:hypothetical protein